MFRIISILIFIIFSTAYAQPDSLWSRTYGNRYRQWCYSAALTSDGGYILAGRVDFQNGSDFMAVKTDDNGEEIWSITCGGERADIGEDVVECPGGGFLISGWTDSFGHNAWLVKLSEDGDSLWSRVYGEGGEELDPIIACSDGGYAIGGSTYTYTVGGSYDFWLVKIDEEGDIEWHNSYGGRGSDFCRNLIQTDDGGYALGGETRSFGAGPKDFFLVKTDSDGEEEWHRNYGHRGLDECYDLIQTMDGGFALTGYSDSLGGNGEDLALVKTDAEGNQQWVETYGSIRGLDAGFSILQREDGGYVIGGRGYTFENYRDMLIIRTNCWGEELWFQTYGAREFEECYDMIATDDGGYILAGFGQENHFNSFMLLKTGMDFLTHLPPEFHLSL
ncbi:MAG: hypothetical protein P9X24_14320 [Candidatus Hatepunaea meridiana]|nr:hypothetical protein [Candidatus Hatepunaea meridiana]